MDQMNGIVAFVQVVEAKGFAAAAKGMGLTPSALSKAVSRLEERLGVQLLRRTTRKLELTADGRAFFDRVRFGLAEIEQAEAFLRHQRTTPKGHLKVSAPVGFSHTVLAPLLSDCRRQFPEMSVELHATDGFTSLMDDGFDVLVRTGHLDDSALVARKLMDTVFVTAASPDYLAHHGTPKRLEELSNHICLAFVFPQTGRHFHWPFQQQAEQLSIKPDTGLSFTNADAMIAAAEAGAGIVHLQSYLLQRSLDAGRLVPVLQAFQTDGGPITALYLPTRHLSPNVRAFVDLVYDRLKP